VLFKDKHVVDPLFSSQMNDLCKLTIFWKVKLFLVT